MRCDDNCDEDQWRPTAAGKETVTVTVTRSIRISYCRPRWQQCFLYSQAEGVEFRFGFPVAPRLWISKVFDTEIQTIRQRANRISSEHTTSRPIELKLHNSFPITSKTINEFSPATTVLGKQLPPILPPAPNYWSLILQWTRRSRLVGT